MAFTNTYGGFVDLSEQEQKCSPRFSGAIQFHHEVLGEVELRHITLGDLSAVLSALEQDDPRQVTARIVQHQLVSPEVTLDEVLAWQDGVLCAVGTELILSTAGVTGEDTVPRGEAFHEYFRNTFKEMIQRYENSIRQLTDGLAANVARALARVALPQVPPWQIDLSAVQRMNQMVTQAAIDALRIQSLVQGTFQSLDSQVIQCYDVFRQLAEGLAADVAQSLARGKLPQMSLPQIDLSAIQSINQLADQMMRDALRVEFLIQETFRSLDSMLAQITPTITSIAQALDSVRIPAGRIVDATPDLRHVQKTLRELSVAYEDFEESDFAFSEPMIATSFIFFRLAQVPREHRKIAISQRMLALSRREEFLDTLRATIANSEVLGRRTNIIDEAIANHVDRNYHASVCTLLPQIEGVFGDLLILRGLVKAHRGKLYEVDTDGRYVRGRRGGKREIKDLGRLVERSGYRNHPELGTLAGFLTDYLFAERNPILHGRKTNYGRAKLSTQALFVLYLLADEVVNVERKLRNGNGNIVEEE